MLHLKVASPERLRSPPLKRPDRAQPMFVADVISVRAILAHPIWMPCSPPLDEPSGAMTLSRTQASGQWGLEALGCAPLESRFARVPPIPTPQLPDSTRSARTKSVSRETALLWTRDVSCMVWSLLGKCYSVTSLHSPKAGAGGVGDSVQVRGGSTRSVRVFEKWSRGSCSRTTGLWGEARCGRYPCGGASRRFT